MNTFLFIGLYFIGIIITGIIIYKINFTELKKLGMNQDNIDFYDFRKIGFYSLFFPLFWVYMAFIFIVIGLSDLLKRS